MGNTYNFRNAQFGNGNIMINTKECAVNILNEEQWIELENFLKLRADETKTLKSIYTMTNETLEYVKKKDERGLKAFIKRNKESFFINVLSDAVSAGLTLALAKLSF